MVHIFGKLSRRCGLVVGATSLCLALAALGPSARSQSSVDEPRYTPSGDLILPSGFETWVFVGSNLGLSYTPDAAAAASAPPPRAPRQQFHNVSINKAAYDYFLANGQFPERTVLMMQVFEAADKEPKDVLASGFFNGRRVGLEVAVKNTSRPDGRTTPWAYYNFTDPSDRFKVLPSATAFPDAACANCHQRHASIDNVWVQFYPALRDKR